MQTTRAIVAGNVTSAARTWLESHGTTFEEVHGLFLINLPSTADISAPSRADEPRPGEHRITFYGEGEERDRQDEGVFAIVVPALLSFETLVFLALA